MKFQKIGLLLVLPLFLSLPLFSQNNKEDRTKIVEASMWKTTDKDFADTVIPAKWRNESMVIICQETYYKIDMANGLIYEDYYFHRRIKLQDRAAVEKYSEFTFNEDYKAPGLFSRDEVKFFVGYKVIKSDGTENIIDMSESVSLSMEKGRNKLKYNKVAIPDLEQGDIIDYYYAAELKYKVSAFYLFDSEYYTFIDEMPVKKQKVKLKLFKHCFLNAKSINGAPELVQTSSENRYRNFEVVDTNRNKIENKSYISFSRDLPILKFQAYYSQSTLKPSTTYNTPSLMAGERKAIKNELDERDLQKLEPMLTRYSSPFMAFFSGVHDPYAGYINPTYKYIRNKYPKTSTEKSKMAKDAFYFLREYNFRVQLLKQNSTLTYSSLGGLYPLDQYGLIHTLAAIYKKRQIDFDILFTTPNTVSRLDDWMFLNEIVPILRVTELDTFYISEIFPTKLVTDLPSVIQGNEAWLVSPTSASQSSYSSKITPDIPQVSIPGYSPDDYKIVLKAEGEISDFTAPLRINYNYQISGVGRNDWDSLIITTDELYKNINSEYLLYYPQYLKSPTTNSSIQKGLKLKKLSEIERRDKFLTELIRRKTGMQDIEAGNFELIDMGRWENDASLEFGFDVAIDEPFVDIGSGYLFNVGLIVGNDSRVGTFPDSLIYNFVTEGPLNFMQIFTLKLPDGYTVNDVDQLAKEIENLCGHFSVEVFVDGRNLVVRTDEILNSDYYTKEKWEDYKILMQNVFGLTSLQVLIEKK